jgi:CD109 antigen
VNTTNLQYVPKSHSVFIQTDKAVYKPGHKVQFRAIVLDAHMKPSVTGALDVYITVSNAACQKHVLNFLYLMNLKGVFTDKHLSTMLNHWPVQSRWNTFTQELSVIKANIAD